MTDQQALDEAVRLTAHERYRDYLDPAHQDYDPRFWPIVRAIAEPGLKSDRLPSQESDAALAARLIAENPPDGRNPCGCL